MNEELFETALGIAEPWHVVSVDLDAAAKTLTIGIDFTPLLRSASPWPGCNARDRKSRAVASCC